MDHCEGEQMVAPIDALLPSSLLFAFVCNRKLAKNGNAEYVPSRTKETRMCRRIRSARVARRRREGRMAKKRVRLFC